MEGFGGRSQAQNEGHIVAADTPLEPFSESRRFNVIAFVMLAAAILLMRQADVPSGKLDHIMLWGHKLPGLCLTTRIIGRPCYGCGLTRATVLAFDGRFEDSRSVHPGAVWVAGWFVVQMISRFAMACLRPRVEPWKDVAVSGLTLFAAIIGPLAASRL